MSSSSAEELKALEEKATGMIDVLEFVPLAQGRPRVPRESLLPRPRQGRRPRLRLLAAALKETGLAALGQYAARGQQYLVLLRPLNGVLVMEQLHYADEVRPTTEVTVPEGEVKPSELDAGETAHRADGDGRFEPEKYKDTVRERVLETIQRRSTARTSRPTRPPDDGGGKIIDLMEAFKASLAATKPDATARRHEAPGRNERLRVQGMEGLVLSRGSQGRRDARLLRRASFRRSRSTTRSTGCRRSSAAGVGGAGARGVHVRDQGEPADHALRAAQARERRAPSSFYSRTPRRSARKLGPILFQLPPNLKKDVRPAARVRRHAAGGPTSTRSSSGTRAGSTTRCTTRCASATSRCASSSSRSLRRRSSRRRRGDTCGCTGSTTTRRCSPSGRSRSRRCRGREAYVYFKHDEGVGSGPPAVDAFLHEITPRIVPSPAPAAG